MYPRILHHLIVVAAVAGLLSSCGIRRHKYADPITKDTEQPDKVLFDRAINDIEHSRYEIARLTLQTLINTYDSSEYLAKAKLAIADSWFREGGAHGLAQAEAEYKDFELFYPQMEEAAEAQERVCDIHYKQMDKADRDPLHAIRAEDECRQLLLQYPNSKFAPETQQKLRDVQEVLAAARVCRRRVLPSQGRYAGGGQSLERSGGSVSAVQPGGRSAVAGGRFLRPHGRPFRRQVRGGLYPPREGLPAEPARGGRQEEAGGDEAARAGSRSGGVWRA